MEDYLPVLQILERNITDLWPHILNGINNASFIALDIEMSGLGDRNKLFYPEMDIRYKYMTELARSFAPLSLGICCFKCTHAGTRYLVETYDLLVMSKQLFSVQADSLKFLRGHGFDFNKLIESSLPYTPGNDLPACGSESKEKNRQPKQKISSKSSDNNSIASSDGESFASWSPSVRNLMKAIIKCKKPLVLHNGLVDLTFLYQHFYAELPRNSESFAADLSEMFPMGIYDTKYIADYVYRDTATYLQFVYIQEHLLNSMAADEDKPSISTDFSAGFTALPGLQHYSLQPKKCPNDPTAETKPVCSNFSFHGWCELGDSCPRSHDLLRIVKERLFKNIPAGRRKLKNLNRHVSGGPNSTGTNAMLMSALKHNAHHQKIRTEKNASSLTVSAGKSKLKDQIKETKNVDVCLGENAKMINDDKSNGLCGKSRVMEVTSSDEQVKDEKKSTLGNETKRSRRDDDEVKHSDAQKSSVNGENSSEILSSASNCFTKGSPSSNLVFGNSNNMSFNDNNGHEIKIPDEQRTTIRSSASEGHSAGIDAFMTAYVFASYINRANNLKLSHNPSSINSDVEAAQLDFSPESLGLCSEVNKIYLMGKSFPFLVRKSPFAKHSKSHIEKIQSLR
ncbi:target of EGR1 protein 1 [Hyalella azteca]|uniref:Target of EGR1 protein 1 n=1 Tax=Hyalella azteca TaxID=294128 RepID=A0A8B7N811_HYAAZ|nr:target of EGR1 protein 1 [Hyalella azteca]